MYTQIHIFKTKSLKYENPHIERKKKKEQKKIRRLSNAFQKVKELESSFQVKTPEESICSNEATTNNHAGLNIEEKVTSLANYLFQNSTNNGHSAAEDNTSRNDTSDSKHLNTSTNDNSSQATTKVQFFNSAKNV